MDTRFIAMLALERAGTTTAENVIAEMRRQFPKLKAPLTPVEGPANRGDASCAFLLEIGDIVVTVLVIHRPIPPGTLDRAIGGSRNWPDAAARLSAHRAHAIVATFAASGDWKAAVSHAQAVTLVTAALSSVLPSIGVYWAAGETVTPAARFRRDASDMLAGRPPVAEWVQFWWLNGDPTARGEPTRAVVTTGLSSLLGREIDFPPTTLAPAEIGQRVLGTIQYLLTQGPVLEDGDTLGVGKAERLRVRHVAEGHAPGVPAYQLILETHDESDVPERPAAVLEHPALQARREPEPAAPAVRPARGFGRRGLE